MSLDLLGENLFQTLKKIENNFGSEKEQRKTSSFPYEGQERNKVDMNIINERFFKMIERMLKGNFIIEREYFFLKSLFFQEQQLILTSCFEALS